MKSIKIKHTERAPHWSPQHPMAGNGWRGEVITLEITNIPDDISMPELLTAANLTVIVRYEPPYQYDYSQFGSGRIIQPSCNL